MAKIKLTEDQVIEMYNEALDEGGIVKIGCLEFDRHRIVEKLDLIAYRCGFNDFIDSLTDDYIIEGVNEDENE